NEASIESVNIQLDDGLVKGQRTLHERFRAEDDQADPIRWKALDQVFQFKFNSLESARPDVRGIHGLRKINRDEDVLAFFFDFFERIANRRACKSNQEKDEICRPDDQLGE